MAGGEGSINNDRRPDPKTVDEFHTNADTDADKNSIHHTLGIGNHQASPGGHSHNGTDSVFLGEGIEITGIKGDNTALNSVIAAMVQILGVTDSTT